MSIQSDKHSPSGGPKRAAAWVPAVPGAVALAVFLYGLSGQHPERSWQVYLINFLLWSGIAQGALVFSAAMHLTRARWSGPLSALAESFAAFFPFSFILFLLLFAGRNYVFPWLHQDLHGKEVWLNLPFLFWRDALGLLALYLLGTAYLYNALQLRIDPRRPGRGLRRWVYNGWQRNRQHPARIRQRMTIWGGLYILAFAVIVSLLGYDLVMSMDPHWVSTLFGAYTFVTAFYLGLGALIIRAALFHLKRGAGSGLTPAHFHDIGKLFFAFCLLWADFFYVQLVVIWYGNISEETHFVILRTMQPPWKPLAWTVFILAFILPFVILLNKKVKTKPAAMLVLCGVVIAGLWLEHLLLLAPSWNPYPASLPLGISDVLITLGFLALMAAALGGFQRRFPELPRAGAKEADR